MELLAIRKTEQLVEACVLTPPVAHALQVDNGAIRAALWLAPPLARLEAVRIVKDAVKKARVKKDSCKSQQNQSQQNQVFPEQPIWHPKPRMDLPAPSSNRIIL